MGSKLDTMHLVIDEARFKKLLEDLSAQEREQVIKLRTEHLAKLARRDEIRDTHGQRAQLVDKYKPNRKQRRAQASMKRQHRGRKQ